MAGLYCRVATDTVALTAATARTGLQLAAATNQRVLVHKLYVGFNGTTSTDAPVKVKALRQTSAGSGSTSLTVVKPPGSETVQTTAIASPTSEPTQPSPAEVAFAGRVHPQGNGVIVFNPPLQIAGGQRLGFEATAAAGVSIDLTVEFEE